MAQVPNLYYNSPWIAQAARSLGDALAPPDPTKLLARDAAQFEFDRAKKVAGQQDEDREHAQQADAFVAKIYDLQAHPIIDAKTGLPDEKATESAVLEALSGAVDKGGYKYVDPAGEAAGPIAPQFTAKRIMAILTAGQRANQINQRFDRLEELQSGKDDRLDQREGIKHGYRVDLQDRGYQQRLKLDANKHQQRMEERVKAAQARGEKVSMMPTSTIEEILYDLDTKEETYGKRLRQKDKDRIVEEIIDEARRTGNPQGAVNTIWSKRGLDDQEVVEADTRNFWQKLAGDPIEAQFYSPKFDAPTSDLGTAATGGVAPEAAATAPASPGESIVPRATINGVTLPQPRDEEDFNLLNSGDDFFDPEGQVRTKP